MNHGDDDDISWWMMNNITADDYSTTTTLTDKVTKTAVPVVVSVIVALNFVGNLSVVIIVAANLQMRSSANTLIASLAVVDLLCCIICLPSVAVGYATQLWPFGNAWCKVSRSTDRCNYTFIELCFKNFYCQSRLFFVLVCI